MANVLTEVTPKLLAQGLLALREMAVMPRLVNRGYEALAAEKGSTINIPIPSAIAIADVAPAAHSGSPVVTGDTVPTSVAIVLDKWKEAAFYMTDNDLMIAMNGILPMQASEAIKTIANQVDRDILDLYKDIYGYYGTAGTTPLGSDTSDATGVRKVLNNQLAPLNDRHIVMNADLEANALNLRAFQDMSWSGTPSAIIQGRLNERLGFNWWLDQNVRSHTAGTAAGATLDTTDYPLGTKTVTLASAGTGTILVGDVFTIAGDTQTYVVTSGDADVSNGGSISFEPGLKVAITTNNLAITLKASHVANLAFHRDAFALASRPFLDNMAEQLGAIIQSAVDPISGLALRLEVRREHKRTRWSFDILYGVGTVRREFAARLVG